MKNKMFCGDFDRTGFMALADEINVTLAERGAAGTAAKRSEHTLSATRHAVRVRQQRIRKTKADPIQGTFAWRIKNAREQMGMSQTRLACDAGVKRVLITNWERESQLTHRFEDVLRVARALDVSLDYIAGLTDDFGCFPFVSEAAI